MLFSWPSLNPGHIDMIAISKWRLFEVETQNTIFVPFKTEWLFDPNVDINLAPGIYTKLYSIWYIGLSAFGLMNLTVRDLRTMQRGVN